MSELRIWTVPNVLSFLRFLALPVIVWLTLTDRFAWAFALLLASGISDLFDGLIARSLNQQSRLGEILDPLADRVTTIVLLPTMALAALVPWWLVMVLLGRDLVVAFVLSRLKRHGIVGLPVHFLGKAATFCLYIGLPFVLLSGADFAFHAVVQILGWGFTLWGTSLYLYSAAVYVGQARHLVMSPGESSR